MIVPPEAAPAPGVAGGICPLGGPPLPGPPTPPVPPTLLGPPLPSRIAWPPGPLRTAMRMSVIFKSDAIEFRLTFSGYASRSAQRPSPAAAAPMPRNFRRPNTFAFVDIILPFATKTDSRLEPVHSIRTYVYELIVEADACPPRVHSWHQYNFAGYDGVPSGDGLCPGQTQLRSKRSLARP